jgi:general secretion pathway protein D
MKTYCTLLLAATLTGWLANPTAHAADAPDRKPLPDAPEKKETKLTDAIPDQRENKPADDANKTASQGDKELRLNFRDVPLEMVLTYLSDAAGFIIVQETKVEGRVNVWSNQPMNKDEAVDLLNTILNKNGYAALRNGRTLTILSRDEAKKRDIPVKKGGEAAGIPKNDEMVTQIIPVRHALVSQLTANLQPLLGTYAEMTANESANTLIITATATDVRRMAEIINALDESISSTATLKVFPIRYADAKELANVIKELFTPTQQQGGGGRGGQFGGGGFTGFGGGGAGGGGFGGGGPGGGGFTGGGGRGNRGGGSSTANTRVVAVADERSNSLVVGAPEDMMDGIKSVIEQIDQPVNDITELRVFHLMNADPMELAEQFAQLFPDETKSGNSNDPNQNQGFRFGGGGFGGFGGFNRGGGNGGRNASANATGSERMKKKGRVLAVPDPRTSSIIISAASETMPQIAEMVEQLDSSPARKQRVFVYSLENADPQQVEQILKSMFERTTVNNRNNQNQNSPLTQRGSQNQGTTTGYGSGNGGGLGGNSGFGVGGGGGRGGGGGAFP